MTPPDTLRPEALRDEIAFIRTLAEEGHKPSNDGGLILVTAGLGWGAASVVQAGAMAGALPAWTQLAWWVPMPLFIAALVHAARQRKQKPSGQSPLSRAMNNAWTGMGCAMGAIIASLIVTSIATNSGAHWMLMPPVFLALYGAGWTLYAVLSQQKWVMAVAVSCFVAAPLTALLAANPVASMLAYAVGLVLLVAAPGFIMMSAGRPSE